MKRVNNGLKITKSGKGYYGGSYYRRIRGTKGGIIPPFNIGLNCSIGLFKGNPTGSTCYCYSICRKRTF